MNGSRVKIPSTIDLKTELQKTRLCDSIVIQKLPSCNKKRTECNVENVEKEF